MRRFFALLCLLFICALIVEVNAHSGGTDESGGHIDYDTGEYHYHHGYPAHSHYDMDGDGDLDCPYNFNDQSGQTSGVSTRSNTDTSHLYGDRYAVTLPREYQDPVTITPTPSASTSSETSDESNQTSNQAKGEMPQSVLYWVIAILIGIIALLVGKINRCQDKIYDVEKESEKKCKEKVEAERRKFRSGITALNSALLSQFGSDYLYVASGAAKGDYLDSRSMPHSGDPVYDHYTFFLGGDPHNNSSVRYHSRNCIYANGSYPINVVQLRRQNYRPCSRCLCVLPKTDWIPKYVHHKEFLDQYIEKAEVTDKKKDISSNSGSKTNYNN